MAETSVDGAIRRKSSGDRRHRAKRNRTDPPLSHRDSDPPHLLLSAPRGRRQDERPLQALAVHLDHHHPPRLRLRPASLSRRLGLPVPCRQRPDPVHLAHGEEVPPQQLLVRGGLPPQARPLAPLRGGAPRGGPSPGSSYPAAGVLLQSAAVLVCLNWLVRLQVSECCFSLGTTVRWPCLKVLFLEQAELSDDVLERIVRGSPVLESLELHLCSGLKKIIIDSASVKELILNYGCLSPLEKIWAPHLLSLQVSGIRYYCGSVFRLDDVSSLVEATLNINIMYGDDKRFDFLKEFLENLLRVSTITINGSCLQVPAQYCCPTCSCRTVSVISAVGAVCCPVE